VPGAAIFFAALAFTGSALDDLEIAPHGTEADGLPVGEEVGEHVNPLNSK